MNWNAFLEPQLLLGIGAFAAGVVNAYVQRRFHQENREPDETDETETEREIIKLPEENLENAETPMGNLNWIPDEDRDDRLGGTRHRESVSEPPRRSPEPVETTILATSVIRVEETRPGKFLDYSETEVDSEDNAESDADTNYFSSATEDLPKDKMLRRKERRQQHKEKKRRIRMGIAEPLKVSVVTHGNETDEEGTLKAVAVQTTSMKSPEMVTNLDNLSRQETATMDDTEIGIKKAVDLTETQIASDTEVLLTDKSPSPEPIIQSHDALYARDASQCSSQLLASCAYWQSSPVQQASFERHIPAFPYPTLTIFPDLLLTELPSNSLQPSLSSPHHHFKGTLTTFQEVISNQLDFTVEGDLQTLVSAQIVVEEDIISVKRLPYVFANHKEDFEAQNEYISREVEEDIEDKLERLQPRVVEEELIAEAISNSFLESISTGVDDNLEFKPEPLQPEVLEEIFLERIPNNHLELISTGVEENREPKVAFQQTELTEITENNPRELEEGTTAVSHQNKERNLTTRTTAEIAEVYEDFSVHEHFESEIEQKIENITPSTTVSEDRRNSIGLESISILENTPDTGSKKSKSSIISRDIFQEGEFIQEQTTEDRHKTELIVNDNPTEQLINFEETELPNKPILDNLVCLDQYALNKEETVSQFDSQSDSLQPSIVDELKSERNQTNPHLFKQLGDADSFESITSHVLESNDPPTQLSSTCASSHEDDEYLQITSVNGPLADQVSVEATEATLQFSDPVQTPISSIEEDKSETVSISGVNSQDQTVEQTSTPILEESNEQVQSLKEEEEEYSELNLDVIVDSKLSITEEPIFHEQIVGVSEINCDFNDTTLQSDQLREDCCSETVSVLQVFSAAPIVGVESETDLKQPTKNIDFLVTEESTSIPLTESEDRHIYPTNEPLHSQRAAGIFEINSLFHETSALEDKSQESTEKDHTKTVIKSEIISEEPKHTNKHQESFTKFSEKVINLESEESSNINSEEFNIINIYASTHLLHESQVVGVLETNSNFNETSCQAEESTEEDISEIVSVIEVQSETPKHHLSEEVIEIELLEKLESVPLQEKSASSSSEKHSLETVNQHTLEQSFENEDKELSDAFAIQSHYPINPKNQVYTSETIALSRQSSPIGAKQIEEANNLESTEEICSEIEEIMNETFSNRKKSLSRQSPSFSLELDGLRNNGNAFETWAEQSQKSQHFYASFNVKPEDRPLSPELLPMLEDDMVQCLDSDNPDRWVIGSEQLEDDKVGRMNAACLLRQPVKHQGRGNAGIQMTTRQQFRDEVLTISNKRQEASMKRRYALTELLEVEECFHTQMTNFEKILSRLNGQRIENKKPTPISEKMRIAVEGMQFHLPKITKLSKRTLERLQVCVMDPSMAATCVTKQEEEWCEYIAYLFHLSNWVDVFLTDCAGDLTTRFQVTESSPIIDVSPLEAEQGVIDARHLLERLYAPRSHLDGYEMMLGNLARYSARAQQPTRELENAITIVRQLRRRALELKKLWPFVTNFSESELGTLPLEAEVDIDVSELPLPLRRMTPLSVNKRKGCRSKVTATEEGFLLLDANCLLFLKQVPETTTQEIVWKLPMSDLRVNREGSALQPSTDFEVWDISKPNEPIKTVYKVTTPNAVSKQAWVDDLKKLIHQKGVDDPYVDIDVVNAHEEADLESRKRYSQVWELEDWTEGTDEASFYDMQNMKQSCDSSIYDREITLHSVQGDDEQSLSYHTAEGPIQPEKLRGNDKEGKIRPESTISVDSFNTMDGISNPFSEQMQEKSIRDEKINEVILEQSISTSKPFIHYSKEQQIDSSEGGEMELTINTSNSEGETFVAVWTFNGVELEPERQDAQPRIEGPTALLLIPKVNKEKHEGAYVCTLNWPTGMQAVFPFNVQVHQPEDDVTPTNESSKLRVKTTEVIKVVKELNSEEQAGRKREFVTLEEVANTENETVFTEIAEERHEEVKSSSESAIQEPINYASKTSVIDIEADILHLKPSDIDDGNTLKASISITEDASTSLKQKTSILEVKQHIIPTAVKLSEGDTFKLNALLDIDKEVLKNADVWWSFNGKKVAVVGDKTRQTLRAKRSGKTIELSKSEVNMQDAGEYTLWLRPMSSDTTLMQANFCLVVEEAKLESKPKEEEDENDQKEIETVIEEAKFQIEEAVAPNLLGYNKNKKKIIDNETDESKFTTEEEDSKTNVNKNGEKDEKSKKDKKSDEELNDLKTEKVKKRTDENGEKKHKKDKKKNEDGDEKVKRKKSKTESDEKQKRPTNIEIEAVHDEKFDKETPDDLADKFVQNGKTDDKSDIETIKLMKPITGETKTKLEEISPIKEIGDSKATMETTIAETELEIEEIDQMKKSGDTKTTEKTKVKEVLNKDGKSKVKEVDPVKQVDGPIVLEGISLEEATGNKVESKVEDGVPMKEGAAEKIKSKETPIEKIEPKVSETDTAKNTDKAAEETKSKETLIEETKPKAEEVEKFEDITLQVGDTVKLSAKLTKITPVQLKNENVWWTRNGERLADIGFSAPYRQSIKGGNVELVKKAKASISDNGVYCLVSEPKIKRSARVTPTIHATLNVNVINPELKNEPELEQEFPLEQPISLKEEIQKELSPKILADEEKVQEFSPKIMKEETIIETKKDIQTEVSLEKISVKKAVNSTKSSQAEKTMTVKEEIPLEPTSIVVSNAPEETVNKAEVDKKPKDEKTKKKKSKKSSDDDDTKNKKKRKKVKADEELNLEDAKVIVDDVMSKATEFVKENSPVLQLHCIEADANQEVDNGAMVVATEGQPLCLTVVGLPEGCKDAVWILNGKPVSRGANSHIERVPRGEKYAGMKIAQFYLDESQLTDSGVYELKLKATDVHSQIQIPVKIQQRIEDLKPSRKSDVLQVNSSHCRPLGLSPTEGEPLHLQADLRIPFEQVSPDTISWSHNGELVSPDDPSTELSLERSTETVDCTSIILHKNAVSLRDSGVYSISYHPLPTIKEEPLVEQLEEELDLDDYSEGEMEASFPSVTVIPEKHNLQSFTISKPLISEMRVEEGETVTLDAEISDNVPVIPHWFFNGREIDATRTSEYVVWHSGTYFALTIPAAAKHHLGVYELRLHNEIDDQELRTVCKIQGKSSFGVSPQLSAQHTSLAEGIAPLFTRKLFNTDCQSGDEVQLICRVVGDPSPHLLWRHNGQLLEQNDRRKVRNRGGTSTLIIWDAEPKDRGTYTCGAANEFGKTQTSSRLSVDGVWDPLESDDEDDASSVQAVRKSALPRSAPDGLMLEKATPSELLLKWSPISEEGVTYTVEISKDNGHWWSPAESGLTTTYVSLPASVASPLQPLLIRLLAENSLGTGPCSTPVLKIPVRASVPQMAAVKPQLTAADIGSVRITWPDHALPTSYDKRFHSDYNPQLNQDMMGDVTYSIEVREGARGDWKRVADGLKEKEYVHHLKPGVATMFRVLATNRYGTSEPSGTVMANLHMDALIPDLDIEPPWTSVIRPDLEGNAGSGHPGLNLHWKSAYLPEFCDKCIRGLNPIYTIEWRKGRSSPWRILDDNITHTEEYRLPNFLVKAIMEENASSSLLTQPVEVRVTCRNEYGSTLPTKSLKLTGFGLTKPKDEANGDREQSQLLSLPIFSSLPGEEKLPLWLATADIDEGVSLHWDDIFRNKSPGADFADVHGKYRMEYSLVPSNSEVDRYETVAWKPIGPRTRPLLGDSFCLDVKPHASEEQHIRLLAMTYHDGIAGWKNAYKHISIPSKAQLLPPEVQGLRGNLVQNSNSTFSVKLEWKPLGCTEGEDMLESQLIHGAMFVPREIGYRIEAQDTTSGHGLWREIGQVKSRDKTSFIHQNPSTGAQLKYRIIPFNVYGDGPDSISQSIVNIPRRLTEIQGAVEDIRLLILGPKEVSLRWRLGDEAIDTLEQMGRRTGIRTGMSDSGYEDVSGGSEDLRECVSFSVERREGGYSGNWVTVADQILGGLTGKVMLRDVPKELYGSEYRVVTWLNKQPCAPSKPARISVKNSELTPDMSYQKPKVDMNQVDNYVITWQDDDLESLYSTHALACTLPQSLSDELTFDIEMMKGNSKEWELLVGDLKSATFDWKKVNPLLPYAFRVIGRNQFGEGQASRVTHVAAQVVIPDLSFVVPVVREPSGILEGREPAELRWQTPRAYTLNNTLTPFSYEVQVRDPVGRSSVGTGSEWRVYKEGLKHPYCSLGDLDPSEEHILRVVAVTEFGRGEPSQSTRQRRGRIDRRSESSNFSVYSTSSNAGIPQFEDGTPSIVYVPIEGDLDLRCTITSASSKETPKFSWSFNYREIPNIPKHEQFPSGYFQSVTGAGRTAELRLYDLEVRDLGTYTCKASNRYGDSVKEFRVLKADAPVIIEVPSPIISLLAHQTLVLPCWIDAVPPAKITWTRDSKRVASSHRTRIGCMDGDDAAECDWSKGEQVSLSRDASLRVEHCIATDAGLYTMIAENPAGQASISCIVRIEENQTPRTITPRWINLDKHYFVLRQLATGSFSKAHVLIDKKTNREYVGKIYALDDVVTRVLGAREFECLNRLHHNNVIDLVDTVVSDDHLVLITERLSGNHLLDEVLLGHSWTEAAVSMIIHEVLEAVAHVHSEGIVHLDIQPENIIFLRATSKDGRMNNLIQALTSLSVDTQGAGGRSDIGLNSCMVKLVGFSMAQPIFNRVCLKISSILPPPYWCTDFIAPELLRGITSNTSMHDEEEDDEMSGVSFGADIWSVGMLTYLLLSGRHPITRKLDDPPVTPQDLMGIADDLSSVEELKNVSPEALDFVQLLLAFDPRNRPLAHECLMHPWLTNIDKTTRNLETNLTGLKNYQEVYANNKLNPTDDNLRENFLRFAGEACVQSLPRRSSRASSIQPQISSAHEQASRSRGFSIDHDLTKRISTLMVPPDDRGLGSGNLSLCSSMLGLDGDDENIPTHLASKSPSPMLVDPWANHRAQSISREGSAAPISIISGDDSSSLTKRICEEIANDRIEPILPVNSRPVEKDTMTAPTFSTPLKDSHINPRTGEAYFSCQLAGVPRLVYLDTLLKRGHKEAIESLGEFSTTVASSVAAAWYLGGCLLSEGPDINMGTTEGGWLWLGLNKLDREQAGKVVECVVRSRAGRMKTSARVLLPEPPKPPGRPGIMESSSSEALIAWACGSEDSCEDLIYKVDVKYSDEKPSTAWKTVGFTVDRRFLISDLNPETSYRVRISVRNAVGWSGYSIASSKFKTPSNMKQLSLTSDERRWILDWRQASHPFGLSDHPEALSNKFNSSENLFSAPPPSGLVEEIKKFRGLIPHLEAVRMLCKTEGVISKGSFNTKLLLRCHPALVERGQIPGQRQPVGFLHAFLVASVTTVKGAPELAKRAYQEAIVMNYLQSSAASLISSGTSGGSMFSQQFSIRFPLLPLGASLGWLANDAVKPSAGLGLVQWVPGGRLIDCLLARGEYNEFSLSRWVYQLLLALRWLQTAFGGRVCGKVDFDHILAARRSSSLPDIVLSAVVPIDSLDDSRDCFSAPELEAGDSYTQLSGLWSVGMFAYLLLTAEKGTTIKSVTKSATPIPTDSSANGDESTKTSHGGYKMLDRPKVDVKLIKNFSKWCRRFVYNTLQTSTGKRGSLEFWLENDWFNLRPDAVKQLCINTIPSKNLLHLRNPSLHYGLLPCTPEDSSIV